tara:strand:+ start:1501 stop:2823 length:1323 start_codon:yes stop_codon:yes gene_type:complete
MKNISIIGGGPAGLGVALFAKNNKYTYELFEANNIVGGNCVTFNHNEFYFDSGAHRLHDKDAKTTELFKSLLNENLKLINIPSQIFRDGKFLDFPISPLNLIKYFGIRKCVFEGIKIILIKKNDGISFKSMVESKYGKEISKLFLLDYSEKLWGEKADNLSRHIAGKRLKGLNLYTFVLEIIFGNKKKTKHLDGSFFYPKYGIGTLFSELANQLDKESIHKESRVTRIKHQENYITEIEINGSQEKKVQNLVSSMPLNKMLKILHPSPPEEILNIAEKIKFRNVILVVFFLNKNKINHNGSMYFPSKKYPFTRVYEPKNRSSFMSPPNKTSLVVEIPSFKNDKYWNMEENEVKKCISTHLIEIGFFNRSEIIDSVVKKIFHAYPVMSLNYQENIIKINKYLNNFKNLHLTGRNGLFTYSHIHDQMISARKIINGISKEIL